MTPTTETWLPIVGFEGQYEVSDHGRVRGLDRTITRGDGMRVRVPGCVLKPQQNAKGYWRVSLQRDGVPTSHVVYHLVLNAFIGPRPPGMAACHGDGDKNNNKLSNLRWDTPSANTLDLVRHGAHNMARKTHCKRRHRLDLPNLRLSSLGTGRRACLACHRAQSLAYQAAKRGETVDVASAADAYYERLMPAA